MSIPKYLKLFIIITFLLFFFTLFNYFSSLTSDYSSTDNEIKGTKQIERIFSIRLKLQGLRGLSQFTSQKNIDDKEAQLIKVLSKESKLLPESNYKNRLIIFLENLNSTTTFQEFTDLINATVKEAFFYARDYQLLFESNPKLYYKMHITVFDIPTIIEHIAKIRGLSVKPIQNRQLTANVKNNILISYENYEASQKNLIHYQSLIHDFESHNNDLQKLLQTTYQSIMKKRTLILTNIDSLNDYSFFTNITRLINNYHLIHKQITHSLIHDLNSRKSSIIKQIIASIFLLLFAIFVIAYYFIYTRNTNKKKKEQSKKALYIKNNLEGFKESLYHETSVEGICTQTSLFFAEELKALSSVIYLHDKTNDEFVLGYASGISTSAIPHFLDTNSGIIGQAFERQEIIKTLFPEDVLIKTSILDIQPQSLLTIPFIDYDHCIAVLQLSFLQEPIYDEDDIIFMADSAALTLNKTQKDKRNASLLNTINESVITSSTNKQGIITYVSDAFIDISGFERKDLIGNTHNVVRHPDMSSDVFADMWKHITAAQTWHGEVKNRTKDGGYYWVDVTITPDLDFYGNILGYTAIRQDITAKKLVEEISITDALTGIYNRRHFDHTLTLHLDLAKRDKKNLVFVLIDIDHFKQYNDTYGHQDGDTALIATAKALNSMMKRPNDFAFRIGGEEFGLLFDAKNLDDAVSFANLARETVEALKINHSGNSASKFLTISMGMFFFNPEKDSLDIKEEEIYNKADKALYEAKESGRNKLVVSK